MKKIFGVFIAAATFTMYSCSEDVENTSKIVDDIAIEDVNLEATSRALMEGIDEAADVVTHPLVDFGGRAILSGIGHRFGTCITVTKDDVSRTKTIDFGEEGCVGRDGRVRKGKIIVAHEGERNVPGFKRTITLENFSVDTIQIEGKRQMTYVSGTDSEKEYSVSLTGGKITFPDGMIATRASDRTRIVTFDEDGEKIQASHYGSVNGVNREGLAYTNTVDSASPILLMSTCRAQGFFSPVSGAMTIAIDGESEKVIDFGDGTCDNRVVITQDGISKEVEIDPKQRRKRRFRRKI